MSAILPVELARSAPTARSRAYALMIAIAALFAFVGFWPTYFGPLLVGSVDARLLIHIHAAVQVSWLALFAIQIYFATTRRIDLHVRFGYWAMALSALFLVVGLALSFDTFGRHVQSGQIAVGQRRLFGFLRDVVVIGAWFTAGWAYRDKPDIHKRIMVVAAAMIIYPAIGRMRYFLGEPIPLLTYMIIWPLPVYVMMIHDFMKKRAAHPVYVIGLLTMLAVRLVLPLSRSELWMSLSSGFVPFYQSPTIGN